MKTTLLLMIAWAVTLAACGGDDAESEGLAGKGDASYSVPTALFSCGSLREDCQDDVCATNCEEQCTRKLDECRKSFDRSICFPTKHADDDSGCVVSVILKKDIEHAAPATPVPPHTPGQICFTHRWWCWAREGHAPGHDCWCWNGTSRVYGTAN